MAASLLQLKAGEPDSRLRNLLPSPPLGPSRKPRLQRGAGETQGRVKLETVLGITSTSNSSFTCDPSRGLIAYFAGCVIVLYCPRKNKQTHIFNNSRKSLSALSFSPDGKYIVTGESGSRPAVRVWDVEEKTQVSELLGHKYGVSCVAFSSNMKYIVSVGYHHDMLVNVWDWKKETVVAKNKVSNKVLALSFAEDSSYFVTVGNRHVKFWYLDASREFQVNGTVPLVGRSGLLGEMHNNTFCGVVCGKGKLARHTFCISHSGILCQFNEKRMLEKWIDLKISPSHSLCMSDDYIFCGCMDGTVRIFNSMNLQHITNLPKPHSLGTDVAKGLEPSVLFTKRMDSVYPDTIAMAFDPLSQWISCVYNDHSLYIWDVKEIKRVGKVFSALYHSSYIWNVELYPELQDDEVCLPAGSFLTCSSDSTIRVWNLERNASPELQRNIYSHDLQKIIYVDNTLQCLKDQSCTSEKPENGACGDIKSGVRVINISPDGHHLASGDRGGNIRIHELKFMDELLKVEGHDGEVLCLEYSKPEMGKTFLASASRDRLIHIFSVEKGYNLEQTLDDHSSSITSVKFACREGQVQMISCGADKSIYFRTLQKLPEESNFTRTHHVVEKTMLYDMDTDITRKYVAIACQDRNVRIYNVRRGKLKTFFKGSHGEDGSLLKVQMDPSGTFIATSCSDRNISIFDLYSGECVTTIFGHSDIVTGMKFTHDCKHLITVSADSCVFVWSFNQQMSKCMRDQLEEADQLEKQRKSRKEKQIRRETFIVPSDFISQSTGEEAEDDSDESDDSLQTPSKENLDRDPTFLLTNGRLPLWARKLERESIDISNDPSLLSKKNYVPCGRWAERSNRDLIKSILGSYDDGYCSTPTLTKSLMFHGNEDDFSGKDGTLEKMEPKKLAHLLEIKNVDVTPSILNDFQDPSYTTFDMVTRQEQDSPEARECIFYPMDTNESSLGLESEYLVLVAGSQTVVGEKEDNGLPGIQLSGVDPEYQDGESLGSGGNSDAGVIELDDKSGHASLLTHTPRDETFLKQHFETLTAHLREEKFDGSLNDLNPIENNENHLFLNPRLSISAKFLSHCQKKVRSECALSKENEIQKMAANLGQIKDAAKININSRRLTDKTFQKKTSEINTKGKHSNGSSHTEISSSLGTFRVLPLLPRRHDSETITRRSSLQPLSAPKDLPTGRASTGSSYMLATESSKAKIWRSHSVGENLNKKGTCMNEYMQETGIIRPSSSTDLSFLGKERLPKNGIAFISECRGALPSKHTQPTTPSFANHETRGNLTLQLANTICDRILMPPPSMAHHEVSQVTQKSYLSVKPTEIKSLQRDEQNITTRLEHSQSDAFVYSCKDEEFTKEEIEFEESICSKLSLSPTSCLEEDTQFFTDSKDIWLESVIGKAQINVNKSDAHCSLACKSPVKINETEHVPSNDSRQVSIKSCELIVQDLHDALQRALQVYNEVTSCVDTGCVKEQLQKKSIFTKAFQSMQKELDSVALDNKKAHDHEELNSAVHEMKSSKENAIAVLEGYYDLLLKMMEKNMHS
ncbi:WD repeat-containing protein 62 [Ambystoma mexicanum]|uniref:WD repeat-containing protein 62 n=1 Tax=Ambystoma mexicanum TaxID=8296 RepID=UPI0037E8184D